MFPEGRIETTIFMNPYVSSKRFGLDMAGLLAAPPTRPTKYFGYKLSGGQRFLV
jgi:hypothetical protein